MLGSTKSLLLAAAIAGSFATAAQAACPAGADPSKWVEGGGKCLLIDTSGEAAAVGATTTLVVLLHGDISSGGPATYLYPLGKALGRRGVVAVAMLRPGYANDAGETSEGSHNDRRDHYTAENNLAVGQAIQSLRQRHKATRVVVMGHSGGAAVLGVLLGRAPTLIDAAVLVSCPCDIPRWRSMNGKGAWPRSQSPQMFVKYVRKEVAVVAITGADDDNTSPSLAQDYATALTTLGVKARFETVPGAGHAFKGLLPAATAAMRQMLASASPR